MLQSMNLPFHSVGMNGGCGHVGTSGMRIEQNYSLILFESRPDEFEATRISREDNLPSHQLKHPIHQHLAELLKMSEDHFLPTAPVKVRPDYPPVLIQS